MKSDVCLECLKGCDWYAFLTMDNHLVIRKLPEDVDSETCVLKTKRIKAEEALVYVDDENSLTAMLGKVREIPKQCEHYCEHVIIGNAE